MKNLILIIAVACFSFTASAATLGKGAKGEVTHDIASVMAGKKELAGTFVRVKGQVKEVCPMKGCWVQLEDVKTGARIKVKVKDDVIVFPQDSVGKTVQVEGQLVARHLSERQARRHFEHLAEELGKKFDPSTVKGPVTLYEIKGQGAEIL